MATGSITSLGLGSGLDLQNILDQLREADEAVITTKKNQKTDIQSRVDAYNTVNAKLFNIKSHALNLSLESNFLNNSVSVTDENVVAATVGDGYDAANYSLEVTQKARRNSWESAGLASKTEVMFGEPAGIADHDTTAATTQPETLTIQYGKPGEEKDITVSLTAGMTLEEITDAVNNASGNKGDDGNPLVKAAFTKAADGDYYIRLSAENGGNTEDSQITVNSFDWIAADETVSIAQGTETMFLSVPPGTSYQAMANLINGAENNPGVTAKMIDNGSDTNPYQLTLTSKDTGEDARLTLTNLDGLTEVTGAGGDSLNAEFTVDGIAYSRQSNTSIKDVIDGVTLELKNTGTSTLNVEINRDTVKSEVTEMIEDFNDLVAYILGKDDTSTEDSEETDETNPLENESSAKRIVSKLQALVSTVIDVDSQYKSMTDLGLSIDRNGTITIDEDTLNSAIASDPDAVKALFLGDSSKEVAGLGDLFNDTITDMVSTTGIASTEIDEGEARIKRLNDDIEEETTRLDKKYEVMTRQFAEMDKVINQIQAQGKALDMLVEQTSNSNSGS
ncbi:MAG: flagellar filament capping protein FliD [Desulfobacter sp.]|nr:MAG: flagellar filament capping protein FliD [Desulfobacter sp.]